MLMRINYTAIIRLGRGQLIESPRRTPAISVECAEKNLVRLVTMPRKYGVKINGFSIA